MTVSLWQDRSFEAERRYDFVVVGAGISGASAAYWLASRGEKVALIDRGSVAAGASGKSAGMLLLGTADPYSRVVDLYGRERAREVWSFSRENRALLIEHVIGNGAHDGALRVVRRDGTASAAVSEHELAEAQRSYALLTEDGFPHQMLDAKVFRDAYASDTFLGGVCDPAGMTIDPARLTRRVVELAVERGAALFEHHALRELTESDAGVVVETSGARFEAEMVLLCTNAYSPLIDEHFAERVYPARGQMLATEPVERVTPFGVYCDFGYEYFWQLETGEVVAGGWRQHHADAEKGYSDETTKDIQDGIWGFMTRAIPALSGRRVTHRWAGVMGFSGDGLPFVGELPGRPRSKYLAGHTGHGFGFAFLGARKLVEMALDGAPVGFLSARRQTLK
ncbi:MAG: NAD(P)/FAD-dependent oxidoreductase [Sandaracinaceae bacterium]